MKSHAMTRFALLALAALAGCAKPGGEPAEQRALAWQTDLPAAQARARAENKAVLINFTGSDWCPWCVRLSREVFSQPEFAQFAAQHLVLVEVDFPRRKAQDAELKKANRALQERFAIEGFPTVVLLDAEGRKLGTLGYQPGGPKPFIAALERLLRKGA